MSSALDSRPPDSKARSPLPIGLVVIYLPMLFCRPEVSEGSRRSRTTSRGNIGGCHVAFITSACGRGHRRSISIGNSGWFARRGGRYEAQGAAEAGLLVGY